MPRLVSRRVDEVDGRTVEGSLVFDGVVDDWERVVREAVGRLDALTFTSVDAEQAFVVFRRKFAASGGIQLEFAVGRGGSELRARSHGSTGLNVGAALAGTTMSPLWSPGPTTVGALLDAIAAVVTRA